MRQGSEEGPKGGQRRATISSWVCCDAQILLTHLNLSIDVNTRFEEELHNIGVTVFRGMHQRCAVILFNTKN